MIITRKLIKLGGAYVISLPKQLVLNINPQLKNRFDVKIVTKKKYYCNGCQTFFIIDTAMDSVKCPKCKSTDYNNIREVQEDDKKDKHK